MRYAAFAVTLAVLNGCARNQTEDEQTARIRDTTLTGQDTLNPSDTSGRVREMPEADTAGGRTLKIPSDSIRLEDTLSAPPPSQDTLPSQR
jgi:hypothetical protein